MLPALVRASSRTEVIEGARRVVPAGPFVVGLDSRYFFFLARSTMGTTAASISSQ